MTKDDTLDAAFESMKALADRVIQLQKDVDSGRLDEQARDAEAFAIKQTARDICDGIVAGMNMEEREKHAKLFERDGLDEVAMDFRHRYMSN